MAAIWCLLLIAAGCAAVPTPDRSERNVFPPYKPIFTPEEWAELMQLFNITRRDAPPLFEEPLTNEQIIQLVEEYSSLHQNVIGRRENAPEINPAPDRSERNVFPPYKPIFTPEEWKEIMQLLNITRRDAPPLFEEPLTYEQIMQLVKEYSSLYQNVIGRREHAPEINPGEAHQMVLRLNPAYTIEEMILQLGLDSLEYDEILAILGEYLKG